MKCYSQEAKQKIMFLLEVYRSCEDTARAKRISVIRDVGCDGGGTLESATGE